MTPQRQAHYITCPRAGNWQYPCYLPQGLYSTEETVTPKQMQKQNHFRLSATDLIPSSQDQNGHQSTDGGVTGHAHLPHTSNGTSDHVDNVFGYSNSNNNIVSAPVGGSVLPVDDPSDNHHLVPSHQSNFNDSPIFTNFEEESLFSSDLFREVTGRNSELESKDIDDDKCFQPIPPSPFVYEEDTTEDYNDDNNNLDMLSVDSVPFQQDNYLTQLLDMDDLHNFSPLESSIGSEIFDSMRMGRRSVREMDNSLYRSETFPNSVSSEHNSSNNNNNTSLELELECDNMNFSNLGHDSSNNTFRTNSSFSTLRSQAGETIHCTLDQSGRCSSFGLEFDGNIICHNSYNDFNLDEQNQHYVASSRKRTISGGSGVSDFQNNNNNADDFLQEFQNNQNSYVAPSRKRMASGDTGTSGSRLKMPRRCSSLGNQTISSISPVPQYPRNDLVTNRPASSGITYGFSNLPFSENDTFTSTNNTTFSQTQSNQVENEMFPIMTSLHSHIGDRPSFPNVVNRYPGPATSVQSSSSGNTVFKRPSIDSAPWSSTPTRPSQASIDSIFSPQTAITNVSSIDVNSNDTLNTTFIRSNAYDSNSHQSPLFPDDNGETGSVSFHLTPSRQTSSSTTSSQQAANHDFSSHSLPPPINPSITSTTHFNSYASSTQIPTHTNLLDAENSFTMQNTPKTTNSPVYNTVVGPMETIQATIPPLNPASLPAFIDTPERPSNASIFIANKSCDTNASKIVGNEQDSAQTSGTGNQDRDGVNSQPSTDDPELEKAYNECIRTGSQTFLIKEELKRKILYKRCVQGIQEVPAEPAVASPSNQLTAEEQMKRKRRLEANRVAAARMRTRKKEQQNGWNSDLQREEDRNTALMSKFGWLEDQIRNMKLLLSRCGICTDTSTPSSL